MQITENLQFSGQGLNISKGIDDLLVLYMGQAIWRLTVKFQDCVPHDHGTLSVSYSK